MLILQMCPLMTKKHRENMNLSPFIETEYVNGRTYVIHGPFSSVFIVDYQKIFTHRVKAIEKEEEKPSQQRESE